MSSSDPQPASAGVSEEDRGVCSAVLLTVLDLHPAQLTAQELRREIAGPAPDFERSDQIDRALRDLIAAGLLHRHGPFVLSTRAALAFDRIVDL